MPSAAREMLHGDFGVADERLLAEIMTDRNGHACSYAIPEGLLADRWIAHLHRDAENLLPLPFREVVEATSQPFAQAIRDLASDHMVASRVVIIGDAAAIPRPHTAASTSKASRPWRSRCYPSALISTESPSRRSRGRKLRHRRARRECAPPDRQR